MAPQTRKPVFLPSRSLVPGQLCWGGRHQGGETPPLLNNRGRLPGCGCSVRTFKSWGRRPSLCLRKCWGQVDRGRGGRGKGRHSNGAPWSSGRLSGGLLSKEDWRARGATEAREGGAPLPPLQTAPALHAAPGPTPNSAAQSGVQLPGARSRAPAADHT